jgi:outer membrane protein assembly factor BamB
VYDPGSGSVFVVTLTRVGSAVAHTLVSLAATDGRVLARRGVDVPGLDPAAMNQRGAPAVYGGRVYVPYGGNDGDCGNYRGSVVGAPESGDGPPLHWSVPTPREGGIWAAAGIAQDGAGNLFVAVGNGQVGRDGRPYDGSDSVVRLSADLTRQDFFAPTGWRAENDADRDLGSTGPLLVGDYVWIQGKSSTGYLLDRAHLGGIGHPRAARHDVCRTQFGGAAAHGRVVYAPCTDGLRQVRITATGGLRPGWRAPPAVAGSPVVGGGVVWALAKSEGTLYALDEADGAVRGSWSVGAVSRFASPTLAGSIVLVPTMHGVTAIALT